MITNSVSGISHNYPSLPQETDPNQIEKEIRELLYQLYSQNPNDTSLLKEILEKLNELKALGVDVENLIHHTEQAIANGGASKTYIGEMMNAMISFSDHSTANAITTLFFLSKNSKLLKHFLEQLANLTRNQLIADEQHASEVKEAKKYSQEQASVNAL